MPFDSHNEEIFPKLAPNEIDRLRRFGTVERYRSGEALFVTGQVAPGMFVLLSGTVEVMRRDPFGRLAPIVEQGPGEFIAEVSQLAGRPALVDVHPKTDIEALLIPPEKLRGLMITEVTLGERIMRALILRRVALIETGVGGPVLIGSRDNPDMVRLQGFLTRNAWPYQLLDPEEDPDAADLVHRYAPHAADLPLAVCPQGIILKNPREDELASALGMIRIDQPNRTYDVAIVGAGPAGLATAVYAASEGLSVVVVDARAFGGQAGASARIENYLGFPTGISGQALAGRAYVQAQKFGAEMVIPSEVLRLGCDGAPLRLELNDGHSIKCSTAVIASGARYRRLDIANLQDFEGRGVWYWASPIEAHMCRREDIVLVGGGNSAGQAAVFLSDYAGKIWMLVRGTSLSESMSQYLIERIEAIPNIEVLAQTELIALSGTPQGHLDRVRWRHNPTREITEKPIRHVFLFIGADPATGWLEGCGVVRDRKGFVLTGPSVPADAGTTQGNARAPMSLESTVLRVFAVGDVRSGSVKRVGAAIGEGAAVVPQLHSVLRGR